MESYGDEKTRKREAECKDTFMIRLTERAAKRVLELVRKVDDPEKRLRMSVEKGGCSGLEYAMSFDLKEEGDVEIESLGIPILVASDCLDYLKGSEVDFDDGLNGKGFEVRNPNAETTCGCGRSFQ